MHNIAKKLHKRFSKDLSLPVAIKFCEAFEMAMIQVLQDKKKIEFDVIGEMKLIRLPRKNFKLPGGVTGVTRGLVAYKFKMNPNHREAINKVSLYEESSKKT